MFLGTAFNKAHCRPHETNIALKGIPKELSRGIAKRLRRQSVPMRIFCASANILPVQQ